jgi:hypothetical protein
VDEEQLEELLTAPAWTKTEEASVGERPVDELIQADRYLKEVQTRTANADATPWGMRVARTIPGGTC